jgi:hypothetical protein
MTAEDSPAEAPSEESRQKGALVATNATNGQSEIAETPDSGNATDKEESSPPSSSLSVRSAVGQGMNGFTEIVNSNLVAFRYGTVATVTLLTAYSLVNTPLFFRYPTVSEIPGWFLLVVIPFVECQRKFESKILLVFLSLSPRVRGLK